MENSAVSLLIPSWDELFMRAAYEISRKSKDKRTKIGAVLVRDNIALVHGYNGLPRKCNDNAPERQERPEKYFWFEHAERNAVYACARFGIRSEGAIMFTQGVPCADCARGIIQAGIREVVVHKQWQDIEKQIRREKWDESGKRSSQMFAEADVNVRVFDGKLGFPTAMDGQVILV
jgi:dCMP deaminase